MKTTLGNLRKIIQEVVAQSTSPTGGWRLGSLSSSLGGDVRYSQFLVVYYDESTDVLTITIDETGAQGGMDYHGPGEGASPPNAVFKKILPVGTSPANLVKNIKIAIKSKGDIIKSHGKPLKNFRWINGKMGLSVGLATQALSYVRGEDDEESA